MGNDLCNANTNASPQHKIMVGLLVLPLFAIYLGLVLFIHWFISF